MESLILNQTDKRKIKEVIEHFALAREAARQSDHLAFRALLNNEKTRTIPIKLLEEVARWDDSKDGKTIAKISKKITEEFSGKTPEKIYEKIEKAFENKNCGIFGRIISSLKKKNPHNDNLLILKKITGYLKIISSLEYTIFNSIVEGKDFELIALCPLKEMANWQKEDDDIVKELHRKMNEKTESKRTLKDKNSEIKKMLRIGGKVAIGLGIAGAIGGLAYYLLSSRKKKEKTEE